MVSRKNSKYFILIIFISNRPILSMFYFKSAAKLVHLNFIILESDLLVWRPPATPTLMWPKFARSIQHRCKIYSWISFYDRCNGLCILPSVQFLLKYDKNQHSKKELLKNKNFGFEHLDKVSDRLRHEIKIFSTIKFSFHASTFQNIESRKSYFLEVWA